MDELNPDKNNENIEIDINEHKEEEEKNKDNEEKENIIDSGNIDDINNKSQNNQILNTNSNLKSFESEKNEKQENANNEIEKEKEKSNEIISQEINETPSKNSENKNNEENKKEENNEKEEKKEDNKEEKKQDNKEDNKEDIKEDNKLEEKKEDNKEDNKLEEKKENEIIQEKDIILEENKKEEKKEDKNEKKEMIKKEEKKKKGKYNIEEIIKDANKQPNIGVIKKSQMKPTINKIKNKSIEQTIKVLINQNDNNTKENDNQFINRLNELKREISKKEDKKTSNNFEFTFKNSKVNNRYKNGINSNKDIDFNFKVYDPISVNENKYKELKDKYLYSNKKIVFTPIMGKSYDKSKFLDNNNPRMSYNKSLKKSCKNLLCSSYNKPIVYRKNIQKINNNRKNDDIFRLFNSTDNIDFILKRLKSSTNNYEEIKNDNFNKYNLLYSSKNRNNYKKCTTSANKSNLFKSTNFENSSKLKNLIKDVFHEIKEENKKTYSLRTEFQNRLSNIELKIKFSRSLNKYSILGKDRLVNRYQYRTKKSTNLNFDDLINLCTKENLKKYSKSAKKGL